MTSKTNPFFPFLDLQPGKFDFAKVLEGVKIPGLDAEALLAAQKKNIEALAEANRLAAAGMQALARRQSEILTDALAAAAEATQGLAGTRDPQELALRQADLAQKALEKGLANMRELAEVISKSANEAADAVSSRFVESLGELKSAVAKK